MMSGPFGGYTLSFAWPDLLRAEVYIDTGEKDINKKLFDELFGDREAVEVRFGEELAWQRLDDRRACRVCVDRGAPSFDDGNDVEEARDWSAEHVLRLHDVFDARLRDRARVLRASSARSAAEASDLIPDERVESEVE